MIIGLTAVFIAKLPVLALFNLRFSWVRLSNRIHFGITNVGDLFSFLEVTGLSGPTEAPSILITFVPYLVVRVFNTPFWLFGHPEFVIDVVLVWVGGWIAILLPLWFWVVTPLVIWIEEFHPFGRFMSRVVGWVFTAINYISAK